MDEGKIKDNVPEPTKELSGNVKLIDKDSVNKICSGQVVISFAIAVKELVENALDADANLIEIKLHEKGLTSIEVSDNGSGVKEKNISGMTAKYHTSKIRSFLDLRNVHTFGFRGEALSSLCAMSNMTILTRHKDAHLGVKVELDHEGTIKKKTLCARSIGTTVTMTNLFCTLPVRKREFTLNINKEFNKMCTLLQAYCLVSKGVRISCTNWDSKGTKSIVMQTHGVDSVLSNISSIFGHRQMTELVPLKTDLTEDNGKAEKMLSYLLENGNENVELSSEDVQNLKNGYFIVEGFLSSCCRGGGRSSKDRQFFYINSRPCEVKNVVKVVNEIYHRYNPTQNPFIYLNININYSEVDINLTPDKRSLLINNEKILILYLKSGLLNTYGNVPSTYKHQNSNIRSMLEVEKKHETLENITEENIPLSTKRKFLNSVNEWKNTGETGKKFRVTTKRKCTDEIVANAIEQKRLRELRGEDKIINSQVCSYKSENETDDEIIDESKKVKDDETEKREKTILVESITCKNVAKRSSMVTNIETTPIVSKNIKSIFETPKIDNQNETDKIVVETMHEESLIISKDNSETMLTEMTEAAGTSSPRIIPRTILLDSEEEVDFDSSSFGNKLIAEINTSLEEIEMGVKAAEEAKISKIAEAKLQNLRFKSKISPSQNTKAEQELQTEISKADFANMEIIGQFNLGFIIVKLNNDLFIVDQHASDEKYNFEILQKTTILQNQPLTIPQNLEMTTNNEMVLLDNLEVFEKNGFKFEIDENACATKKIKLIGKPFSRNWDFGKEDIDELIFMLQDAPEGTTCRPSRIRDMFASRACRKSVMVGKALNKTTMTTLITHMGEIEQPWNCPHGRPTMRHLINIGMLLNEDDDNA